MSFGAELERVDRAQRLVAAAPRMARCQIVLGKPPKSWDGTLDIRTSDGWVRFGTANWRCHLLPMGDGVAVVVQPLGTHGMDHDTILQAAEIAVQSEVGELIYARRVRDVSVVALTDAGELPGIRCAMSELRTALGTA